MVRVLNTHFILSRFFTLETSEIYMTFLKQGTADAAEAIQRDIIADAWREDLAEHFGADGLAVARAVLAEAKASLVSEPNGLLIAAALIDVKKVQIDADTKAAGKNEYGVWRKPNNEAHASLSEVREQLLAMFRASVQGIRAGIVEADVNGPISYGRVHPVSPSGLNFYRRDTTSPSGVLACGGVSNVPEAHVLFQQYQDAKRVRMKRDQLSAAV
jgi:hypothetical protein